MKKPELPEVDPHEIVLGTAVLLIVVFTVAYFVAVLLNPHGSGGLQ